MRAWMDRTGDWRRPSARVAILPFVDDDFNALTNRQLGLFQGLLTFPARCAGNPGWIAVNQ